MYSLTRLLFRALRGRPLAQVIAGIALIPVGGLISFAAMSGEYIFPYWIVGGIVLAIVGVIFIIRGAMTLLKPKPSVQQAYLQQTPSYTGPGQYVQQQPSYTQSQPPQYPRASYAQPQAYEQMQYPQE